MKRILSSSLPLIIAATLSLASISGKDEKSLAKETVLSQYTGERESMLKGTNLSPFLTRTPQLYEMPVEYLWQDDTLVLKNDAIENWTIEIKKIGPGYNIKIVMPESSQELVKAFYVNPQQYPLDVYKIRRINSCLLEITPDKKLDLNIDVIDEEGDGIPDRVNVLLGEELTNGFKRLYESLASKRIEKDF